MAVVKAATLRGGRRLFCSLVVPSRSNHEAVAAPVKPSTNLFVTGLSDHTKSDDLKREFSRFGRIRHAAVVTDYFHDYSLGFGFVRYDTLKQAAKAVEKLNDKVLDGSKISVEYARRREPSELRSTVIPWKWTKIVHCFRDCDE